MPAPKPPAYSIPSSAYIAARRPNGLSAVSTFSGCGGGCLGLKWAGYRILWASEFVAAAAETYRANHPGVPLSTADVREVTAEEILDEIDLKPGELDLLEGSPPCASFSAVGKGVEHWGASRRYSDVEQRSDDLFFEFTRLVEGIQPKAFVAENVAGLTRGASKGYFKRIHAALAAAGYRVEAKMLDAQWLTVPQVRPRVIFVGIRNDLELAPAFPQPASHRYVLREALPAETEIEPEAWLEGYAIGDEWDRLPLGRWSERYFNLIRCDPELPAPAVTAYGARAGFAAITHPIEKRKFSIAELRRICGFPDDFVLTGTYEQRWERLGRAVPPPMMLAISQAIAGVLRSSPA